MARGRKGKLRAVIHIRSVPVVPSSVDNLCLWPIHFRALDEFSAVFAGDQIRVGQPVLTNRVPDLHDASNIALYGSSNAHLR